VNVQCTPPHLAVNYGLKADANPTFKAALTSLIDVRLPALLEATSRAKLVAQAGDGLGVAASGAVNGAITTLKGKLKLKQLNGLDCAVQELPKAKALVSDAADNLTTKLNASKQVVAMLGFES
jgi:hypothetical protein